MIPLSISKATKVYRNASQCRIIRHWVEHPGLAKFSQTLRDFSQKLGADAGDDFWRQSLGPIRKLGFTFCSTPLPFSDAVAVARVDWGKLHRQIHLCEQLYPDAHNSLSYLVQQLEILSKEANSPFTEILEKFLAHSGNICVVLRNPRMNQAVAEFFARTPPLREAKIISPSQLRGGHICNVLAVIGPCSWFPDYIFSAPRSTTIQVISPSWIRDSWRPSPIFLHESDISTNGNSKYRIGIMPRIRGEARSEDNTPTDILPEDLLPPIPTLERNGVIYANRSDINEETVTARLCHIIGHRAVFVAADRSSSSLIIDTTEMGFATVKRIPIDYLEQGHFLLFRTTGGGDFIAPLADRIMGKSAEQLRSDQKEWKQQLILAATKRFGNLSRRDLSARISAELQSQGLSHTRPANIHYWISSKCIRPRKMEDFVAILTFAGLRERAEELWLKMGNIDRAHKRAGFAIRRMLLRKIAATSLEPLERDGEMIFELSDEDGGALSAYQIIQIDASDYEVPTDQIGVLIEMED